jgi:hypothetical protein
MNTLPSRKQLLIAESELNRAQLVEAVAALTTDLHGLRERAKSFGAIASSVAVLITGLVACQRGRAEIAGAKSGWWQTIIKGAGLVSTLRLAFRARSRHPGPQPAADERQNHVAQH